LDREFLLYLPASLLKDEAVPLVFVYHGGGGEAKGTMNLTKFNSVADRGKFIAIYPQGVGKSWNDGRVTKVSQAHRDEIDDVAFFDVMLERLSEDHRIDPKRVFVTGISNGGIFAHFLAARRSENVAAIAPVTGGIAEPFDRQFKPTHPVSVLMIQGTEDPLVPFDGGRIADGAGKDRGRIIGTEKAAQLWLVANGIKGQPIKKLLPDRDPIDGCRVESIVWSGGRGGSEVWLYRVEGGGHTWPGGIQYLPRAIIGRVTHDIDSQAIWDFFATHPKQE
jgi:polyhydroxybutyrate depolymerase